MTMVNADMAVLSSAIVPSRCSGNGKVCRVPAGICRPLPVGDDHILRLPSLVFFRRFISINNLVTIATYGLRDRHSA
ncbi:hypothetical protein [uncultured Methanoregula sp.]|uniref:hypothetical protein n=1 Tax=uncultured Methanoregula sp. TaxID=1005933 RepID=UPI002AAC06C0|nr:hypothetical protein [uncultured Methanoregula sp.]